MPNLTKKEISEILFQISSACRLTVRQPIGGAVIPVSVNGSNIQIRMVAVRVSEELKTSALQMVLYADEAGVADLLFELQRSYADLVGDFEG